MSGLPPIVAKAAHVEGPAGAPADEDPIAELRRISSELRKQATETFPVPGYGGKLVVRYKRLDPAPYREILHNTDETVEQRNAQFLISACDEILWCNSDGTLRQIEPGTPVTFALDPERPDGKTLDDILGRTATSAYSTVLGMFEGNWAALNRHAQDVDIWMTTLRDVADEMLAGESPVTR